MGKSVVYTFEVFLKQLIYQEIQVTNFKDSWQVVKLKKTSFSIYKLVKKDPQGKRPRDSKLKTKKTKFKCQRQKREGIISEFANLILASVL